MMTAKGSPGSRSRQILANASRLFADKGYAGTSIRLIAGTCGISEAAIYRHYDGKAHLYEEVIRDKARQHDIRAYLSGRADREGIEEMLIMLARHILALADRDPELIRLMHFNRLDSGPGSAVLFKEVRLPYIEFLRDELSRRISAGEIREVDPYITGRCFVGMVMDCALSADVWGDLDGTRLDAETVICNNVPIFARGLHDGSTSRDAAQRGRAR